MSVMLKKKKRKCYLYHYFSCKWGELGLFTYCWKFQVAIFGKVQKKSIFTSL